MPLSDNHIITGANFERTRLSVHGKVLQIHEASCTDCQALRVQNSAIGKQSETRESKTVEYIGKYCEPDKPVGSGDGVEVGLLPVVNISIRLPDLPKHLNAQRKSILGKYFSDNPTFDCNKTLLNLNKLSIVSE